MKKLLRHKWISQDGFRVHKCSNCKVTRYWDASRQRLMFKWKVDGYPKTGYTPPECKSIFHCDKIEN